MKPRYAVWFLTMLCAILCCACAGAVPLNSGRELNEPLSEEEMAVPHGRYQHAVDTDRTGQVGFDSPQEEPVVQWEVEVPDHQSPKFLVVDSEGCTWCTRTLVAEGLPLPAEIIRLNPDGTTAWQRSIPGVFIAVPVLVCSGAVVFQEKVFTAREPDVEKEALEAIDYEGNTRWRSEPVESNIISALDVWRISGDRLLFPVTGTDDINVYSLSDGELVETWSIPELGFTAERGPLELSDGGLIHYMDSDVRDGPTVARFSPDFTIQWEHPVDSPGMANTVLSPEGVLLVGGRDYLRGLDIVSGEVLWSMEERCGFCPSGLTQDGNFLVETIAYDKRIMAVDPDGNEVWRYPAESIGLPSDNDIMVYSDGSILLGHREGITLLNADGSVRWAADQADLGFPADAEIRWWSLNPAPDGRIVACTVWPDWPDSIIISLGPADNAESE